MKVVKTKGSRVLQFNKRELSVLNRARDIMMEASDKLEARFVELGHDDELLDEAKRLVRHTLGLHLIVIELQPEGPARDALMCAAQT